MKEIKISISLSDPNQKKVYLGEDVEVHADLGCEVGQWFDACTRETFDYKWSAFRGLCAAPIAPNDPKTPWKATLHTACQHPGAYTIRLCVKKRESDDCGAHENPDLIEVLPPAGPAGPTGVPVFGRTSVGETGEVGLSLAIREGTADISFNRYQDFINEVLCPERSSGKVTKEARDLIDTTATRRGTPFPGIDAYQTLKVATEVFLMLHTRVLGDPSFIDQQDADEYNARHNRTSSVGGLQQLWSNYLETLNGSGPTIKTLPYLALIRRKLGDQSIVAHDAEEEKHLVHLCDGIQQAKLARPCFLELIWSYWHEEGMLVQTMHAIAMRFQNKRASARDPLANFDIDPLRPLSNLLWGYIQDEQHRLTIARRAYEYDHHYGITLHGKAVPALRSVDSRSKFLEAFHNLLTACNTFYKQDDNKMIIADSFPLLNALKEVHLLLAEGAHNQYGDLPSTARIEMLMQQWILARPEMREFIAGRTMVPYAEPWMDHVDGMKRLQGWSDVTVNYFHDLARFGEQLLLSLRYGSWSQVHQTDSATNWARDWRSEVKQYIHAYRAVTGVDLAPEATGPQIADRDLQPSVHLRRRLEIQRAQQPGGDSAGAGSPRRQGTSRNGGNGNGQANGSRSTSPAARRAEKEFNEEFE